MIETKVLDRLLHFVYHSYMLETRTTTTKGVTMYERRYLVIEKALDTAGWSGEILARYYVWLPDPWDGAEWVDRADHSMTVRVGGDWLEVIHSPLASVRPLEASAVDFGEPRYLRGEVLPVIKTETVTVEEATEATEAPYGARFAAVPGEYSEGFSVYTFVAGPRDGDRFDPKKRISGTVANAGGYWVAHNDRTGDDARGTSRGTAVRNLYDNTHERGAR